jgi:hypothetical protein
MQRNYQVALTLGNHPIVDLMVQSPNGKQFSIDVKGLYKHNFWAVRQKVVSQKLFYVLAFVPQDRPNEFFIMTQIQVNEAIIANWEIYCTKHGFPGRDIKENPFPGVEWKRAERYRNKWDALPL